MPAEQHRQQRERSDATPKAGHHIDEAAPNDAVTDAKTFGERLRSYRAEAGLTLSELAMKADVSKGYLSSLENDSHSRRPSADIMYKLAKTLGVTMSDLMGRKLLAAPSSEVPPSLAQFAEQSQLADVDIRMLASIRFRGEPPKTAARWRFIYDSIRASASMDD